jgi:hypothetical protein
MVLAVGAQSFLGLAQAGAWNSVTSVGSRVDVPVGPGGMKLVKPFVKAGINRGFVQPLGRYGQSSVEGEIGGPWFPEGFSKILTTALIRSSSVDAGNDFITHTFAIPTTGAFDNEYGLVLYENRDLKLWRTLSAFAKTLTWTVSDQPFVEFKAGMIGASRTRETAVASPTLSTLTPMSPYGDGSTVGLIISATINGVSYTDILAETGTITINTGVDLQRAANRQAPVKPKRSDRVGITGSFTFPYSSNTGSPSEDFLAAWDSGTVMTSVTIKILGETIAASSPSTRYELRFVLPTAYIVGEDPAPEGAGTMPQTYSLEVATSTMTSTPPTLVVVSNETLP